MKILEWLNTLNNLDWVLPLLMVLCLSSYVAVGYLSFMSGAATGEASCHYRVSLFQADLKIANAQVDRMAAWTRDCRVTFSAPIPAGKKFATMICPDSTVLVIEID